MKAIINFDDQSARLRVLKSIGSMRGLYRLEITKCRGQRTLQQNAYYWSVVVPSVKIGVEDVTGELQSTEAIHEMLKQKFLSKEVVHADTGKIIGSMTKSTEDLDITEFTVYLDQISQFARDYLNVEVPTSEEP